MLFTSYFETQLVLDTMEHVKSPWLSKPTSHPTCPTANHARSRFIKAFNNTARKNLDMLTKIIVFMVYLFIGIDPSMTHNLSSGIPQKAFSNSRTSAKIQLHAEWFSSKASTSSSSL